MNIKSMENTPQYHQEFLASPRKHILNITNHGIHQWEIIPGLTDTGGQNVFVNQFSDSLADQGFKVTIINRGGYLHPISGEMRRGLHYKNAHERIFYLEDGVEQFVRKEDMEERIHDLGLALEKFQKLDGSKVDLIISHYWDAAELGFAFNKKQPVAIPHIWVPHSLGLYKKRNVSADKWEDLRVDERIGIEKQIVQQVDGIGATSGMIRDMVRDEYGYHGKVFWLPPCIDTERFFPRQVNAKDPIWEYLGNTVGLSAEQVRYRKIITEVSRTVPNKRKDVLIKAYQQVKNSHPETLLVISIDENEAVLARELHNLIDDLDLHGEVIPVGSIWQLLPTLYAVTDIFCTPSVVEGFGMTPQEAAATKVAVVSSDGVPYATEYLLGDPIHELSLPKFPERKIQIGQGAIVVPKDDIEGFAFALGMLLADDELRTKIGVGGYQITIPEFTWEFVTRKFLKEAEILVA